MYEAKCLWNKITYLTNTRKLIQFFQRPRLSKIFTCRYERNTNFGQLGLFSVKMKRRTCDNIYGHCNGSIIKMDRILQRKICRFYSSKTYEKIITSRKSNRSE